MNSISRIFNEKERLACITLDFELDYGDRIGAFNIQVFGKSKAGKPEVMDVLAKIIRTYDVVAIQEIRDKDQTALPTKSSMHIFTIIRRLN